MNQPRTLIEFLHTAREYLQARGVENPRGDAERLLGKTLSMPRLQLYLQHDRQLSQAEIAEYRKLITRRGKREPLQLIVGNVEFAGARIAVQPGLLIPRPETEELAEYAVEWVSKNPNRPVRVLDIGTGTGCLAISIATRVTDAFVDAVDIDPAAVRCARENAGLNQVSGRVRVLMADVFAAALPDMIQPPYDMIVSNPPYVAEADYHHLAPEIRGFESKQALVAGDDELMFYSRYAALLPALLRPGGLLAVEIGHNQAERVKKIFSGIGEEISVRDDMAGVPRIVAAVRQVEERQSLLPVS